MGKGKNCLGNKIVKRREKSLRENKTWTSLLLNRFIDEREMRLTPTELLFQPTCVLNKGMPFNSWSRGNFKGNLLYRVGSLVYIDVHYWILCTCTDLRLEIVLQWNCWSEISTALILHENYQELEFQALTKLIDCFHRNQFNVELLLLLIRRWAGNQSRRIIVGCLLSRECWSKPKR